MTASPSDPVPQAALAALQAGATAADLAAQIAHFAEAARLAPLLPQAHFNLGTALKKAGRLDQAFAALSEAVRLAPDFPPARVNLGTTAHALGRLDEARRHLEAALQLAPKATIWLALGRVLADGGNWIDACGALDRAVRMDGSLAPAWALLGSLSQRLANSAGAITCFRRCLQLNPTDIAAHSDLIHALCQDPATTPEMLLTAARAFDQACVRPLAPTEPARPARSGRIRIAYCSPDLYTHPVGFFWAPIIATHDRDRFEVFVYDDGRREDHITQATRAAVDHWSETRRLDDAALAERVRADNIHVLVDLSGHTGQHRLLTLARRPAPLQGVAGGHFCTTGMGCLDFLVSDRWHAPEGWDKDYTEPLLRLPAGYVAYRPPDYAPSVGPLPAEANGFVTFALFNRLAKLTAASAEAWARVMAACPGSRMLMVSAGLEDQRVQAGIAAAFQANGIGPERLRFLGSQPHARLLELYNQVDLALDSFPYAGGLTTCEALWMGVPVVTLAGRLMAGRHSLSHLSNIGLPELVADSVDSYVAMAVALANDRPRLAGLRAGLRPRMAASPLCDVVATTRAFEAAIVDKLG